MMTKMFKYPEVVHNHIQNSHSVDDHNVKRHSTISIEVVWGTKQWPNFVFAFLFAITEVNCFLSESHFTIRKHDSMMDYRRNLPMCLVFGTRGVGREAKIHKNPARHQSWVGVAPSSVHCLCKVQTYCKCSPGDSLCSHCFSFHIEECNNNS